MKGKKPKRVHFGDVRYHHYKDSTPLKYYAHLDHLDPYRRMRFKIRFGSPGRKYSARWFSWHYLW